MSAVSELLTKARAAHLEYRQQKPRFDTTTKQPTPGDTAAAADALERAARFRIDAHDLDPQHADPAWASDTVPHADLMAFYARELVR